ncbi:4-amino-4-deoxy-L-arabinose-phosphoundecaprenol flippase subunit ArnF [Candidatus Pantoea multigeneris]|uniref:Probable 4-amino-4-deoxy-L-arabinose-phosphoundecaprenol flippase subunit ArnF n=1 Tax=Candidatus Pantoea multigeneris TaxID=2608357 RepID=A0ABX0R7A1_9GAMM|nr:4-amino-4-deoxy-L-arabinose-phosphoundecaprenol flippase subunit ArnF [Pantoea multigeneris]NIF21255.1 4-amino-4-deoxy-L-arabinose-phospho-UDP flippase [Pantoea multigeneris]
MKGYLLALCSVLLVTLAQLLLRHAMTQLPDVMSLSLLLSALKISLKPLLLLLVGFLAYGLSMLCWTLALRSLALSRAYPLLSLSYVLVWLAAISLPGFHEAFSWTALAGMVLILTGLVCICLPRRPV